MGAKLGDADLSGADLRRANLIEADFGGAELIMANYWVQISTEHFCTVRMFLMH